MALFNVDNTDPDQPPQWHLICIIFWSSLEWMLDINALNWVYCYEISVKLNTWVYHDDISAKLNHWVYSDDISANINHWAYCDDSSTKLHVRIDLLPIQHESLLRNISLEEMTVKRFCTDLTHCCRETLKGVHKQTVQTQIRCRIMWSRYLTTIGSSLAGPTWMIFYDMMLCH